MGGWPSCSLVLRPPCWVMTPRKAIIMATLNVREDDVNEAFVKLMDRLQASLEAV